MESESPTFPLFVLAFLIGFLRGGASILFVSILLFYYAVAGFTATDRAD